jgi:hypothetical protein
MHLMFLGFIGIRIRVFKFSTDPIIVIKYADECTKRPNQCHLVQGYAPNNNDY